MIRECSLEEISDGKLYSARDMVRADCLDCKGCSSCCRGMGISIQLDPLDIHRLKKGLQKDFAGLMEQYIELNVVDGLVLPNMKMGDKNQCAALNNEGRCSIHSHRPGICRLFPLGRVYQDQGFAYFLQSEECRQKNRGKVKVAKWIDTPNLSAYEKFVCRWHYFIKAFEEACRNDTDEIRKQCGMILLNQFYVSDFSEKHFYEEIEERINRIEQTMK